MKHPGQQPTTHGAAKGTAERVCQGPQNGRAQGNARDVSEDGNGERLEIHLALGDKAHKGVLSAAKCGGQRIPDLLARVLRLLRIAPQRLDHSFPAARSLFGGLSNRCSCCSTRITGARRGSAAPASATARTASARRASAAGLPAGNVFKGGIQARGRCCGPRNAVICAGHGRAQGRNRVERCASKFQQFAPDMPNFIGSSTRSFSIGPQPDIRGGDRLRAERVLKCGPRLRPGLGCSPLKRIVQPSQLDSADLADLQPVRGPVRKF